MHENRVLRRISVLKRQEVTGWRKLDNGELRDLCSPNTITVIISRRMRWVRRVAQFEI
jgi:hypothetical protein